MADALLDTVERLLAELEKAREVAKEESAAKVQPLFAPAAPPLHCIFSPHPFAPPAYAKHFPAHSVFPTSTQLP